jgi:hypothetical protein
MTVFRKFEVYGFVRKFGGKSPPERKAANRWQQAEKI